MGQCMSRTPPVPAWEVHDFVEWVRVGSGGFADVYRAKRVSTGEFVAIKRIRKSFIVAPGNHRRLELLGNELHAMRTMRRCPWVVTLRGVFQDEKFLYLVMDMFAGGSLLDQLQTLQTVQVDRTSTKITRRFSVYRVKLVVAQLCIALKHCHARGILHRDVKSENVFIDERGYCALGDMGVSMCMGASQTVSAASGTTAYMAPEIFLSKHEHGPAADVYAMGITAYQLLVGHRPKYASYVQKHRGCTLQRFMVQHSQREVDSGGSLEEQRDAYLTNVHGASTMWVEDMQKLQHVLTLQEEFADAQMGLDWFQSCLIWHPKYRASLDELQAHPWLDTCIDWDEMEARTASLPRPHVWEASDELFQHHVPLRRLKKQEQEFFRDIEQVDVDQKVRVRTWLDAQAELQQHANKTAAAPSRPTRSTATVVPEPELAPELAPELPVDLSPTQKRGSQWATHDHRVPACTSGPSADQNSFDVQTSFDSVVRPSVEESSSSYEHMMRHMHPRPTQDVSRAGDGSRGSDATPLPFSARAEVPQPSYSRASAVSAGDRHLAVAAMLMTTPVGNQRMLVMSSRSQPTPHLTSGLGESSSSTHLDWAYQLPKSQPLPSASRMQTMHEEEGEEEDG